MILIPGKKKRRGQRLTDPAKECRFRTVIENECLQNHSSHGRGKIIGASTHRVFSEREFMEDNLMKIWRGGVATNKERLLTRLRAETTALMRFPKFSTQGDSSQGVENKHYGVQARRRESEAAGERRRWVFFSSPFYQPPKDRS